MTRDFNPLPAPAFVAGACFRRPAQVMLNLIVPLPVGVALDSPAADVLTDFRRVAAVTIDPGAAVDGPRRALPVS